MAELLTPDCLEAIQDYYFCGELLRVKSFFGSNTLQKGVVNNKLYMSKKSLKCGAYPI
nr:MAG TPA: hypothetical protein [Caudoviricetes sp.]